MPLEVNKKEKRGLLPAYVEELIGHLVIGILLGGRLFCLPAISGSSPFLVLSASCGQFFRQDNGRFQAILRKVLRIESNNKIDPSLLSAETERIIAGVWGNPGRGADFDFFCPLTDQVHDSSDYVRAHPEASENFLVLIQNVF